MYRFKYLIPLFAALGLILLTSCAAGPNPAVNTAPADGDIAGFWLGVWHGFICPVTFIISLFKSNVHFYEVHNDGTLYNVGFFLGLAILSG